MPHRPKPKVAKQQAMQGKAYANRTDLNNAANKVAKQAPPGMAYGKGAQTEAAAQSAAPLAQQAGQDMASVLEAAKNFQPRIQDPFRPTDRPDEPITAGAPFGAGPGPESLPPMAMPSKATNPSLMVAREILRLHPSEELLDIIAEMEGH